MNPPSRIVTPERRADDVGDTALRPQLLSEFVGQQQARANLSIFIEAARKRGEALDHVLFVGPPGLGKTTLAQIVARELGVGFRATSGPVIAKAGDLAALLTNLEERDVLFIDEIHRLSPAVEEVLYPAMEDFQLDLIIGEGPAARSVKIELAKFTLVGATTRAGLLTNPLRDRFGIPVRLNFYTEEELEKIVTRGARVLKIGMTPDGANEIARRARGTPRIAGRLLRRVRDFASAADTASIDRKIADHALSALEVDAAGLDAMDRRYLTTIAMNYGGGPVGVETMAAALSEPRDAIEDIIEPFLIQCGYLQRTPRGRLLTSHAFRHLGLAEPARDPAQFGLFGRAARKSSERAQSARDQCCPDSHLDGAIRDGRHHMQIRVYYEDTDFTGIVYHANYLRFMERGRTNHLRLMGAEQHALFAEAQAETPGFAFVVRSMQIDYLKPARMDDVLDVVTWPVAVKGASITLAQEVRRGEHLLVKAEVRVAFISEGRAQPIPKALRALLKADLI